MMKMVIENKFMSEYTYQENEEQEALETEQRQAESEQRDLELDNIN